MPIITAQNEVTIIKETTVAYILDVTQQHNLVAASAVLPFLPVLTANEIAGLTNANAPTAVNPYATIADVVSGSDPTLVVKIAGQTISGHRMVMLDSIGKLTYPNSSNPAHATLVYGMALGSAILNDPVSVKTYGNVTEPSWTWTPNVPLFLNGAGVVSETPPVTGFSLIIGFSTSATSVMIDIKDPLVLV